MMGGFGYGMGLFGGFGMLVGVLFWVALLSLVVWAVVEYGKTHTRQTMAEESTLEVLKRRYAKGEISQAEYLQARKDLD